MLLMHEWKQSARRLNAAILVLLLDNLSPFTVLDMLHEHSKQSRGNPLQEAVEA